MGCGCTKKGAAGPQEHVYVDVNGKATVYPSAVQAKAAKIRDGNRGTVRPR